MKRLAIIFLVLAMALCGCTSEARVDVNEPFIYPMRNGELAIALEEGTFQLTNPEQARAGCYVLVFEAQGESSGSATWIGTSCDNPRIPQASGLAWGE